jgi:hypothetical protein
MKTRPTLSKSRSLSTVTEVKAVRAKSLPFGRHRRSNFPVERRPARRVEKPAQVEVFRRYVVADNEHIARALHRPDDRLGQLVAAKRWQE